MKKPQKAKKASPAKASSTIKRSAKKKANSGAPRTSKKTARVAKAPSSAKPASRSTSASSTAMRRADYGAPIDGFFAKQPPPLFGIVKALRELIEQAAPQATASLKWGMPFYQIDGVMMCAIGGHKSHINLILPGPPGTYADPDELLEGDGKTGRRLVVRDVDELPRARVRTWLRTAVKAARQGITWPRR